MPRRSTITAHPDLRRPQQSNLLPARPGGERHRVARALPRIEDENAQSSIAPSTQASRSSTTEAATTTLPCSRKRSQHASGSRIWLARSMSRSGTAGWRRAAIHPSSGHRRYQDDIIRELARNNCSTVRRHGARRSDGMWEDEASGSGNIWSPRATNARTDLPHALHQSLRRAFFSRAARPCPFSADAERARRMRRADRAVLLPEPSGSSRPSPSYTNLSTHSATGKNRKERLLVQDCRVCACGWGCRQEGGKYTPLVPQTHSPRPSRLGRNWRPEVVQFNLFSLTRHRRLADAVPTAMIRQKRHARLGAFAFRPASARLAALSGSNAFSSGPNSPRRECQPKRMKEPPLTGRQTHPSESPRYHRPHTLRGG